MLVHMATQLDAMQLAASEVRDESAEMTSAGDMIATAATTAPNCRNSLYSSVSDPMPLMVLKSGGRCLGFKWATVNV